MQNNSSIVRRFIEETIKNGKIESADQFVWEDVVEQVPFPGQGPGLEGLKGVLRDHAIYISPSKSRLPRATKC